MKDSVRKGILDQLISLDELVVKKALDKIRKSGNHQFVGPLMQRLITGENILVHAMILQLFQDLKDKPSMDLLIDEMADSKFDDLRSKLLECAWQSGIDLRHRLDDIINMNLKGDYMVCLETLTVVENFDPGIDNKTLERNIEKMKTHMLKDADTSDELRLSMIEVLENFKVV